MLSISSALLLLIASSVSPLLFYSHYVHMPSFFLSVQRLHLLVSATPRVPSSNTTYLSKFTTAGTYLP
ncbi:hypothetical protein Hypma_012829 [Hypsizygus marmoreus]|uniref:Secreted protein n=1 Tax=Hypsizygus marmoreus TaxID=39966 RepID=A0A369JD86_HYPMA|nr:hypothetical protein Hypma_012829 [Hypsizygus marmoreus]